MKHWRVLDEAREGAGTEPLPGIPAPLSVVLARRGVRTAGELDRFLRPRLSDLTDPFLLPDMRAAVDRIWRAIETGESMVVFGDYDVDGITSAALMVEVLGALGGRVSCFLPNRIGEGYGLGVEPVRRCLEQFHPGLIITTDCGTGSVEAVQAAREAGADVVVTDHHEVGGDRVAPAVAVVNPKLGGDRTLRRLAGVGVAFKVCHALLKAGRERGVAQVEGIDLREHLDLAALGTIADVVPLLDENRILASHGLAKLNQRNRTGLHVLGEMAGAADEIGAYHVAFVLGPRLNAAGRMGTADAALELLLTRHEPRARNLALELDGANRERKRIEQEIIQQVEAGLGGRFDPGSQHGIVVGGDGWHVGVIGVVAARLSARYGRPAIVVGFDGDGMGRGSCRSVEGFDLLKGLETCRPMLSRYGGHAMAAGLELRQADFGRFKDAFHELCETTLKGRDFAPVLQVDGWLGMGDVQDREFMRVLEQMAPFGEGNPEPVWGMREVRVEGAPRVVGGKHLKFRAVSGSRACEAIGFNMGDRELPEGPMDIAFTVRWNTYQGRRTIQLQLQDFRTSAGDESR